MGGSRTSALIGTSSSFVCTSLPSVSIMIATEYLHQPGQFYGRWASGKWQRRHRQLAGKYWSAVRRTLAGERGRNDIPCAAFPKLPRVSQIGARLWGSE